MVDLGLEVDGERRLGDLEHGREGLDDVLARRIHVRREALGDLELLVARTAHLHVAQRHEAVGHDQREREHRDGQHHEQASRLGYASWSPSCRQSRLSYRSICSTLRRSARRRAGLDPSSPAGSFRSGSRESVSVITCSIRVTLRCQRSQLTRHLSTVAPGD